MQQDTARPTHATRPASDKPRVSARGLVLTILGVVIGTAG